MVGPPMATGKLTLTGREGSGTCAVCGKHSSDMWLAAHTGSIKRVRICGECRHKILNHTDDDETFNHLMRMLD